MSSCRITDHGSRITDNGLRATDRGSWKVELSQVKAGVGTRSSKVIRWCSHVIQTAKKLERTFLNEAAKHPTVERKTRKAGGYSRSVRITKFMSFVQEFSSYKLDINQGLFLSHISLCTIILYHVLSSTCSVIFSDH